MKTYEEMAQSALRRIDEHNKIKAKRKKAIIKTVTPIICVCLISVLCIGLFKNGTFEESAPIAATDTTQKATQAPTSEAPEAAPAIPLPENSAPVIMTAPLAPNTSDDEYEKFINRKGSAKGKPALNFSIDMETINGEEALKNPDIAKILPKSNNIEIKYIHYVPEEYDPNSPNMFIEGYVHRQNNESTRFMINLTPLDYNQGSGFNINTFSADNFSWETVLGDSTSVFGDGYSFYCHNNTSQYLIYVEDTEKETLLTIVDSLK